MESFHILAGNSITHAMIADAIMLDRISYDDIYQLSVETCISYYKKNCDIYIMAIDNHSDRVIGYINFSPIDDQVYEQLTSGKVIDTIITDEDVLSYVDGNLYYGYFSSIVVHPQYRQHGIATKMLLYWSNFVSQLAKEREIYFKGIVADAVSNVGAHLLSEIGFTVQKSSLHSSNIMTLDLFSKDVAESKFNQNIISIYKEYDSKGRQ